MDGNKNLMEFLKDKMKFKILIPILFLVIQYYFNLTLPEFNGTAAISLSFIAFGIFIGMIMDEFSNHKG